MLFYVTEQKKPTIHQVTTMLATPKMSYFQVITTLLTTGTEDLTLWLLPECNFFCPVCPAQASVLNPQNGFALELYYLPGKGLVLVNFRCDYHCTFYSCRPKKQKLWCGWTNRDSVNKQDILP